MRGGGARLGVLKMDCKGGFWGGEGGLREERKAKEVVLEVDLGFDRYTSTQRGEDRFLLER